MAETTLDRRLLTWPQPPDGIVMHLSGVALDCVGRRFANLPCVQAHGR